MSCIDKSPVLTCGVNDSIPVKVFPTCVIGQQQQDQGDAQSHIREKSPGQNGSRQHGFESFKYERLYLHEIIEGLDVAQHTEDYRIEYNAITPHEALSWNSPLDVHLGRDEPTTPNFFEAKILPTS